MKITRACLAITGLAAATALAAAPAARKSVADKPAAKHKPAAPIPSGVGDVTRAQMMAQVKKTFALADANHDGFISRAEFAQRMGVVLNREAPPTKAEAQRMLDAANRAYDDVDTNHDGKLSLAEASVRPLKAFDMMDANHDGVLTVAEKAAAHQNAPSLPYGPSAGEQQGPQQP